MKKILLTLGFATMSLFTAQACTAQASSSSTEAQAQTETTETPEAAPAAEASPVRHIDAAYLRANIYDYKENPNKFVFKGSRPAIIDFYADWCGPCRSLSPKLEAAAKKYAVKVDVYKVNVENEAELSQSFGVRSIPMVLFIPMTGTPIQTVGDLTAEQIEETIAQIYKGK